MVKRLWPESTCKIFCNLADTAVGTIEFVVQEAFVLVVDGSDNYYNDNYDISWIVHNDLIGQFFWATLYSITNLTSLHPLRLDWTGKNLNHILYYFSQTQLDCMYSK